MKVYFTRHAQKDNSAKFSTEDHLSRHLTSVGMQQSKLLGIRLKEEEITKVITSNMPRSIETAEIIASILEVEIINRALELREADPCLIPNHPERDEIKIKCWANWDYKPDHGESYNEGRQRFKKYFWELTEKLEEKDKILIVTHGRVLRLFLSEYLENGTEIIKTLYSCAALTLADVDTYNKKMKILYYNDNDYLPEGLRI